MSPSSPKRRVTRKPNGVSDESDENVSVTTLFFRRKYAAAAGKNQAKGN
jgi:hypothetical protein